MIIYRIAGHHPTKKNPFGKGLYNHDYTRDIDYEIQLFPYHRLLHRTQAFGACPPPFRDPVLKAYFDVKYNKISIDEVNAKQNMKHLISEGLSKHYFGFSSADQMDKYFAGEIKQFAAVMCFSSFSKHLKVYTIEVGDDFAVEAESQTLFHCDHAKVVKVQTISSFFKEKNILTNADFKELREFRKHAVLDKQENTDD